MFRICKTQNGKFAIFAKYPQGKLKQISVEYEDKKQAIKALCSLLYIDALKDI